MSNELTYPELWLLELGVSYDAEWKPFYFLPDTAETRRTGLCLQWNCPANGLSGRELCDVLWQLFDRGEIHFRCKSQKTDIIETAFVPTKSTDICERMAFEFHEERRTYRTPQHLMFPYHSYQVTSAGVARWETYAVPNWDRYYSEHSIWSDESGDTVWSRSATTEAFAREVVEVQASDPSRLVTLYWETLVVTQHEPWTPLPGKALPHGVTLKLNVTEHDDSQSFGDEDVVHPDGWKTFNARCRKHHDRFRDICNWYQNGTHNHPDRPPRQRV